jgi:hypothetical protein
MKFIESYYLFENLQQADNFIAKNNLDPSYYEKLKEIVKAKGKMGLMYILTLILYNSSDKEFEFQKITEYLDKIVKYNVKIDTNVLVKNPQQFYYLIDRQIYGAEVNKFVDEYAPGFLKKEIKKNYLEQISKLNFQSIDKDALRGKMSIFDSAEDWINYITRLSKGKDNLAKLKSANDVEILYENNDWLIYIPKSYEAINYINYSQWCTIHKPKYEDYIEKGYYFIVLHNKIDKKLSYIVQVFPEKDVLAYENVPENMKNYFTLHPYNGKAVYLSWESDEAYFGWDLNKLKSGILKLFFDKYVKNGKIVL